MLAITMYERHKQRTQRYTDFICMRTLMPNKEHAMLLKKQEELKESGNPISLQDLMVKIVREWGKREGL